MAASFCSKCMSTRIANVSAKCNDMCSVTINNRDEVGYVPSGLGIGSGDYIHFAVCLNCGKLDGKWPKEEHELEQDDE